MLWLQGFENAPDVVKTCLRSWKTRNPTWTVVELSEENLPDYVDSDALSTLKGLDVQRPKLANLIRLYLISRHGGVWVDATCLCCQPLDRWLPHYMDSGFFAFRDPGPDRILANWFLAARKGNALASTFFKEHCDFFLKNHFPLQHTKKGKKRVKRLGSVLNVNTFIPQLWTYRFLIKTVKAYPYFIFHYHFARTVRENDECRRVWNATPRFSAVGPLKLSRAGILSPTTDQLRDDLKNARDPVYKLKWHYRKADFKEGCILDEAMRSVP